MHQHSYLWIKSNQTTCWANAGGINVNLYSTTGLTSGNNTGFVRKEDGSTVNYSRNNTKTWSTTRILYVAIY